MYVVVAEVVVALVAVHVVVSSTAGSECIDLVHAHGKTLDPFKQVHLRSQPPDTTLLTAHIAVATSRQETFIMFEPGVALTPAWVYLPPVER